MRFAAVYSLSYNSWALRPASCGCLCSSCLGQLKHRLRWGPKDVPIPTYSNRLLCMLQVIIVMDPAAAGKPRLPIIRHSTDIKVPPREKRYVFDKAYDGNTDNRTLYNGTVKASMLCPCAV